MRTARLAKLALTTLTLLAVQTTRPALADDTAAAPAIAKDHRTLVVVAELSEFGDAKYKWLYTFLEANAVGQAQKQLSDSYHEILALSKEHATLANLHSGLHALSLASETRVVDTFVHLHGSPDTLWFHEGPHGGAEVRGTMAAEAGFAGKLRVLYSTACYGDSVADDWLASGFKAASGALKVNANGMYDYPALMTAWHDGKTIGEAQDEGNNVVYRKLYDGIAANQGFSDVDSTKVVHGDRGLTIDSAVQ